MEWRDEGVLLSVRRHGESAAIIDVFTVEHGRHAGVVRGGGSRKMHPVLQPGAQLQVEWRARLEDHLGVYSVEPLRSRSAAVMADRAALAGLNAISALLGFALPERASYPALYAQTQTVLDLLGHSELWPLAYLRWELALLEEMGFGLDLGQCAATGAVDDLRYVSPRTGRAVSAAGAGVWADRLLPLPACLLGGLPAPGEIAQGLVTTGHFLEHHVRPSLGDKPLPQARTRLVKILSRPSEDLSGHTQSETP
ncbi:DNA repair protein RecO [Actibacterium sp. 188UL27-1]|uniref:DNA repair protein RecO n=1 Tax=Actibacterium sp. 188UL27-1 TaxID=2786961 RepID=UPI00195ADB86|nr:DNA repair protein RecO [Actibacterium sp. 188UL27-1]MBM7066074.1 DNA repair protein RecO [Actibacterium sp. 188UL27-1]